MSQYASQSNGNGYYEEPLSPKAEDDDTELISQDDYWQVINSFFEGKGLVRQQLESFNEFIENTMQEIVDERARLTLDQHAQFTGAKGDITVSVFNDYEMV
jgi:DNA-directed RNA polymerase II subunit RPB2